MSIDAIIESVIGHEGRYSNHPADTGGPTMWGITERVARRHGFTGDMRQLPRETAKAIYLEDYVNRPGFASVAALNQKVAEELVDTGVNMGPAVPAIWFQEWLNAFNDGGTLYPDIKEDGDIGPGTLAAFRAYLKARGAEAESVMLKGLNCSQGERYKQLARGRLANEAFEFGWIRTRVGL